MGSRDTKTSEFDRTRSSLRQSVRLSTTMDDEEFALAAMGISDGYRPHQEPPSSSSGTETPTDTQTDDDNNETTRKDPHVRTPSQAQTTDPQTQTPTQTQERIQPQIEPDPDPPTAHEPPERPERPSSIAKTHHNDSFSLRHDGAMGPINEAGLSRESSTSGQNPFIGAEEQPYYNGPTAPSHPYENYNQNIGETQPTTTTTNSTDNSATTTAATAGPEVPFAPDQSYDGPRGGPSHPYGMYAQNTVGDEEGGIPMHSGPMPVGIPVGFPPGAPPPTTATQYRRRIGEGDAEVADIVGPDGHTEELPPYSRYPDETYALKVRDAEQQPLGLGVGLGLGLGSTPLQHQPIVTGAAAAATRQPVVSTPGTMQVPSGGDSVAVVPNATQQQQQSLPTTVNPAAATTTTSAAAITAASAIPTAATEVGELSTAGGPPRLPSVIPGAGGMGLATRNPEFSSSSDDLSSPRSRYSGQSFGSGNSSSHEINPTRNVTTSAAGAARAGAGGIESGVSEKRKPKPLWKQKAEKKLWGVVPYWAICLVFGSLILMGVVLGAVIGTFLSKQKKPFKKQPPDSDGAFPATITVTLDATPLQTKPADLRSLEEGDFSLPIVSAARSSKSCFNNTLQSNAWSCNIVYSQLMFSIAHIDGNPDIADYSVNLSCNQSLTVDQNTYSYGTQPPCFNENFTMNLVKDVYEPNRGPAWFMQLPYDKTVILPETFLSLDDSVEVESEDDISNLLIEKRFSGDKEPNSDDDETTTPPSSPSSTSTASSTPTYKRRGIAYPGDKPWICTWGGTLLEVFVYANQDSNGYRGYTSMSALGASYLATATVNPWSHNSPAPTTTSAADGDDKVAGTEGQEAPSPTILAAANPDPDNDGDDTTPGPDAAKSATATATSSTSSGYGQWPMDGPKLPPPPYPRVVKIEERRLNALPARIPVCQQWEILEDGGRRPARDERGQEIIVEIAENESPPRIIEVDEEGNEIVAEFSNGDRRSKRSMDSRIAGGRRRKIDAREFEVRVNELYYVDERGLLRERETAVRGQDLSDCGCLWWTL